MNTKLLKQVANRIVRYPEKYDQNSFCGTSYCIAGHACVIKDGSLPIAFVDSVAVDYLELSDDQAALLFCLPEDWSKSFRTQYAKAKSAKGRARVGYRRIMAFIKSKGKI